MLASLYRQASTHRLFSIIAILLSYIPFVSTTSSVICYNASGSPDDSYVACDATGVTTHACCLPDDICFQNGLCVGSLGAGVTPYYTSKCTNPTYNATGCFKNCNDVDGNGVQECDGASSGEYCCYGTGGCDCDNSSEVFGLGVAVPLTTLPASTSSAASISSAVSVVASTATITTKIVTTTAPAVATASSSANTSGGTNATARDIGLGVGIPVGIICLGVLFWLYQRYRRRKQSSNNSENFRVPSVKAFDKPELDGRKLHGSRRTDVVPQEADSKGNWPVTEEAKDTAFEMPAP